MFDFAKIQNILDICKYFIIFFEPLNGFEPFLTHYKCVVLPIKLKRRGNVATVFIIYIIFII